MAKKVVGKAGKVMPVGPGTGFVSRNVSKPPIEPLVLTPTLTALCEILKWQRPHESVEEIEFCKQYIEPIAGASQDGFGNYHVICPPTKESTRKLPLFSCHTDTVHDKGGKQVVLVDQVKGEAFIDGRGSKGAKAFGTCLGADDGTGVWLMLNMIQAKVPGYYIFHRAEENGGKGSAYIRDNWKTVFGKRTFDVAIAFDRKGTDEIITHQHGTRCASDTCGDQLKALLNKQDLVYTLSTGGSFTDTANYKLIIPECFNLGVGYYKQHGPNETQDLRHADKLRAACLVMDWEALTAFRDPSKIEPLKRQQSWQSAGSYNLPKQKKRKPIQQFDDYNFDTGPDAKARFEDIATFIQTYPLAAIELFKTLNVTESDILDAIERENTAGMGLYNDITRKHFGYD